MQQKKNNQNMKQNNEKVGKNNNPKKKWWIELNKKTNLKEKCNLKIQQVNTNEGIINQINLKDLQQGDNNIV